MVAKCKQNLDWGRAKFWKSFEDSFVLLGIVLKALLQSKKMNFHSGYTPQKQVHQSYHKGGPFPPRRMSFEYPSSNKPLMSHNHKISMETPAYDINPRLQPVHSVLPNGYAHNHVQPDDAEKLANLQNIVRDLNLKVTSITTKLQLQEISFESMRNGFEGPNQQSDFLNRGRRSKADLGNFQTSRNFLSLDRSLQQENTQKFEDMVRKVENSLEAKMASLKQEIAQQMTHSLLQNEKLIMANCQKLFASNKRLDEVTTNFEQHMELVNEQINSSLAKLVNSLNQKMAAAFEHNISTVSKKIETLKGDLTFSSLKMRCSLQKAESRGLMRVTYEEAIKLNSVNVVLGERVYYLDPSGYLIDENYYY